MSMREFGISNMGKNKSANPRKLRNSLEGEMQFNHIDFAVIFQTILITIFVLHFMALTWYFGIEYNPRISWISVDGNWPEEFRIGNHFFGDYYQLWQMASEKEWNSSNIYPPFATALFKTFSILPYKLGLFLHLVLMGACVLVPLLSATSRRKYSERLTLVLIFGVFSVPFISIIDRGNNMGLIIPLIYFAILYSNSGKSKSAILLGFASAIKIYPILLAFLLPTSNRIKLIVTTFTTALSLNFFAAFFWGNPFEIAKKILNAQSNFSSLPVNGDPMIFSSAAFTLNISNYVFGVGSTISELILENQRLISLLIFVITVIGVKLATKPGNEVLVTFFALSTLQLVPITSYTYTRWWSLLVIALLLHERFNNRKEIRVNEMIIWTACLLNIALIKFNEFDPVSIFPTISYMLFLILLIKSISTGLVSLRQERVTYVPK
jgi:hypothetical protein